jgi:hypothetical protein
MSEAAKPLADRISTSSTPLNAASSTFTPTAAPAPASTSDSWADQVASPTEKNNPLDAAQQDGASEPQGGSGLQDSQYDVEVKLSQLQANTDSPLYSIHSFEELGLYELSQISISCC